MFLYTEILKLECINIDFNYDMCYYDEDLRETMFSAVLLIINILCIPALWDKTSGPVTQQKNVLRCYDTGIVHQSANRMVAL